MQDLDTRKKKKKGEGEGEKRGWWRKIQLQLSVNFSQHRHKSNCALLVSLPQSMLRSAAVNFLLWNFFADVLLIPSPLVGNSKGKEITTISSLYFPKKAPNFQFQKYLLGLLSPSQKKMSILFLCGSSVLHFQPSFWGGGAAVLVLFMSEHTNPGGSNTGVFHFSTLPVCPYTHLC